MDKLFHSVRLESDLCRGCTNCVRRCPTEAIRVRKAKAYIIDERCIDCGECIKVCPNHAKNALVSHPSVVENYKFKIALPAPALFAQFNNLKSPQPVINALHEYGFDMVYEVASAAEVVTEATKKLIEQNKLKLPVISSACPAVIRLIRVRFPALIENILPLKAPAQFAALDAKRIAMKMGYKKEEIGTVFISPCPAKVTSSKAPLASNERYIDEVVAIRDIYTKLLPLMNRNKSYQSVCAAGAKGINWGSTGGESAALGKDWLVSADGVENVIRVLEDIEDDKLNGVQFVELNMCDGGCVGGVLNVENPYIAKTKLNMLSRSREKICTDVSGEIPPELSYEKKIEYLPVMQLDEDITLASKKLAMLKEIEKKLCGLDCGCCGAPSCRALAEDIVRGFATEDYCVYRMAESYSIANNKEINVLPKAFRAEE